LRFLKVEDQSSPIENNINEPLGVGDWETTLLPPCTAEVSAMTLRSIDDPKHWHYRAEEMRVLAEEFTDITARATMLRLADDYDTLGDRAEERVARNRQIPSGRLDRRPICRETASISLPFVEDEPSHHR
jgi:hypothetical protein